MSQTTRAVAALLAAAAFAVPTRADTTMRVEVSTALAEDWHSTVQVSSGDSVDVRVVVSYSGAQSPVGFGAAIFQPTVSNWGPGDVLAPLVNNGVGGQRTSPIGAVQDLPGQYGRIIPYAQVAMSTSTRIRGHVNTVGGTTYLRIAQAQVTSWFGGPGNTTVGSGVNMLQLSDVGRTSLDPPFSTATTNIVLFKFGITLDAADASIRTMTAAVPIEGVWAGSTGFPHIEWFRSMTEITGSLREQPTITNAHIFVNVPAPASLAALGVALVSLRRRRPPENKS